MLYPAYKFVDTAKGEIRYRNKICELSSFELPSTPIDCYTTYFRFDDLFLEHFNNNYQSVSKYQGKCISDYIPIDIDNKNLNESLRICRDFVNNLKYEYDIEPDSLGIFFSGSKGFHIEIPVGLLGDIKPSSDLPVKYKRFILSFGSWGFDTAIYEKVRLWRVENSFNSKSGLYKVRLTPNELYSLPLKEIQQIASKPRDSSNFPTYDDWDCNKNLSLLWKEAVKITKPKKKLISSKQNYDFDFLSKGVQKGYRNDTAFKNAKKLKRVGIQKLDTSVMLIAWNQLNDPPLLKKEINRVVTSVFAYNINDSDSINFRRMVRDESIIKKLRPNHRTIFYEILFRINSEPKSWLHNGKYYYCGIGQMVLSSKKFAELCNDKSINKDTVDYTLKILEKEGRIIWERLDGEGGRILTYLGIENSAGFSAPNSAPKENL